MFLPLKHWFHRRKGWPREKGSSCVRSGRTPVSYLYGKSSKIKITYTIVKLLFVPKNLLIGLHCLLCMTNTWEGCSTCHSTGFYPFASYIHPEVIYMQANLSCYRLRVQL